MSASENFHQNFLRESLLHSIGAAVISQLASLYHLYVDVQVNYNFIHETGYMKLSWILMDQANQPNITPNGILLYFDADSKSLKVSYIVDGNADTNDTVAHFQTVDIAHICKELVNIFYQGVTSGKIPTMSLQLKHNLPQGCTMKYIREVISNGENSCVIYFTDGESITVPREAEAFKQSKICLLYDNGSMETSNVPIQ